MRFGRSARAAWRKFPGWPSLLALLFLSAVSPASGAENPKRVFLLEGLTDTPAVQQTVKAFRQRLNERSSGRIEVYNNILDLGRFRGPEYEDRLVQFLNAKFGQLNPDVIVPISRGAVVFAIRHRHEFARDVPIVYCCTAAGITPSLDIPPDIPGIVEEFDWAGTLALAERLQPDAKTLVIISGASNIDSRQTKEAIRALQPFLQKYETRYLTGLAYDELLKQIARLPRNSIVLLTRYFVDGSGRSHDAEIATDLSRVSSAPIYSPLPTYFGSGIVGGRMDNTVRQGAKVADLVLEILSGKDPSTLPHQTNLPLHYRVDLRQLERFGLSEISLPPGTSVEFRQPTLGEQYRGTVIAVLLAFTVQAGVIVLLLTEIRRRQAAEEVGRMALAEAELRRKEVTHLMRVGIVSELSGGIAHELGQPLSAILANAQAAQRLMATGNPNKKEVVEILGDIVEEDSRAAEVIHRLRRLLKKEERQTGQINLNDEITSALRLVHSELVSRRVKVQTSFEARTPFVSGDRVQLQQVFLNLIMNAMDAMAAMPLSERMLRIGTRSAQNGDIEVTIADRGRGISPDELKRVFEPYFTTKEHGLGLGLPICSRIVRSHHGQLNIANAAGGGVTAVVSLPAALRLAVAS